MSAYQLGNLRIVDLTKYLDPATETRRCNLRRFYTGGLIPDYHTDIDITSHLGTHCECPYHHDDLWPDASALPLTAFMGRAIYVMIKDVAPNGYITKDVLNRLLDDKVQPEDIIILDSPYQIPPFTAKTNTSEDRRLFINGETAQWMVDHKIKCVGFGDGVSVENSNEDVRPFHDICMVENILFLEVLANLECLKEETFFMSYAPLYIKGLDSAPVRAYAIEGIEGF